MFWIVFIYIFFCSFFLCVIFSQCLSLARNVVCSIQKLHLGYLLFDAIRLFMNRCVFFFFILTFTVLVHVCCIHAVVCCRSATIETNKNVCNKLIVVNCLKVYQHKCVPFDKQPTKKMCQNVDLYASCRVHKFAERL